MIRKLILALGLLLTGPALAQSFPKPPDVPAYVDPAATSTCGLQACYASGTTVNVYGDGSTSSGGTPPAFANELADIPTPSRTSWVQTASQGTGFCALNGTTCTEPKFRTHAVFSHVLYSDPIRNYGQPGQSHCHMFFGNRRANAYSTYATLRNKGHSTAVGGDLNKTAYWHPCFVKTNPFADGKNYAIKMDEYVIYYNGVNANNVPLFARFPRGLRYVLGYNMDDPDNTVQKREIAAANAQSGTAGRYSLQGYGNGLIGILCSGTGSREPTPPILKNADGTDPFAALAGGTCSSGQLSLTANAPDCWDGKNLWSPGGYKHMRYAVNDAQAVGGLACPQGWYRLPQLQVQFLWTTSGFADYGNTRLSSDDMAATKLNSLPTCVAGYTNAPCNDGGGTRTVQNGNSFHTDWLGGWDYATMQAWQTNCIGTGNNTPHQCDPQVTGANEALLYNGKPDGFNVVLTNTYGSATAGVMILLPSQTYTGMRSHSTH